MTVLHASQPTLIYQYMIYSPGLLIPGRKELNKEKSQHQPICSREEGASKNTWKLFPTPT